MIELNKFLTEAMGLTWHSPVKRFQNPELQHDFLTWEGFGMLWGWAITQKWWVDFIRPNEHAGFIDGKLINPKAFAKAVADFLEKQ